MVIPKEIRAPENTWGDPLEIFVDRDRKSFEEMSPIGSWGFVRELLIHWQRPLKITMIADRDSIIAVSGAPRRFLNKRISQAVERIMEDRKPVLISNRARQVLQECITEDEAGCTFTSEL